MEAKVIRIDQNNLEQAANLFTALARKDDKAIGEALKKLETPMEEAEEVEEESEDLLEVDDEFDSIMFGISEGFRFAAAIMELNPDKRKKIFGTDDVLSILKDDYIEVIHACIDNDVIKQRFAAGDKVNWKDEVVAVLSDDGGDEVTVIDNSFHTFQVMRHELELAI